MLPASGKVCESERESIVGQPPASSWSRIIVNSAGIQPSHNIVIVSGVDVAWHSSRLQPPITARLSATEGWTAEALTVLEALIDVDLVGLADSPDFRGGTPGHC